MTSIELANNAAQLCLDKRASDVIIMDLRGLTSITDCFVICSVDSDIQAKAVSGHIRDELIKEKIKPWHVEGYQSKKWVLLDFVDVVVHIFQPEAREFFGLERLWGDAKIIKIKDTDETKRIHSENTR